MGARPVPAALQGTVGLSIIYEERLTWGGGARRARLRGSSPCLLPGLFPRCVLGRLAHLLLPPHWIPALPALCCDASGNGVCGPALLPPPHHKLSPQAPPTSWRHGPPSCQSQPSGHLQPRAADCALPADALPARAAIPSQP
ncbi:hypothetical protein NDU88_006149 [Pleurodeles waltl]|uniref:Uncharacterized protein n=1 Tax=Pleurodeles waltl TaxID=8319 RepID=A0AAV7W9Y4_PLEWA|nr:hypothetical protein NDU88_006149 [Pleurodeles waltl]